MILDSEQISLSEKDLYHIKNIECRTELYEKELNKKEYGVTVFAEKKGDNILITKENFGYEGFNSKIVRVEKIEISKEKLSKLETILKG